jgi:hypothetical protein
MPSEMLGYAGGKMIGMYRKTDMLRNKPRLRKPGVMSNSENKLQVSAHILDKLMTKNGIIIPDGKQKR